MNNVEIENEKQLFSNNKIKNFETCSKLIHKYYPEYRSIYVDCKKLLSLHVKPGMKLLDAGCGKGISFSNIRDCLPDNLTIIGVDDDKESLEQNACCDELYFSDLEKLPFEDSTFDIVMSFYVMEHLRNPEIVLSELIRILKKSGIIILILPNINNPLMLFSKYSPFIMHRLFHKLFSNNEKAFPTYFRCNNIHKLDEYLVKLGLKKQEVILRGCVDLINSIRFLVYPWIIYDKITNISFLKFTKADICVFYMKV